MPTDEDTTKYGPTDTGFVQRYYADVVDSKRQRAIEYFGPSVDLTNSSIIGQFINSTSYEEALIWQIAENIYYSRFVQYATGKALDDVVFAKGIFRKAGANALGEITVTKDPTYNRRIYIAVGTIVSDIDGLYPFQTTAEAEFPADTTITSLTIPIKAVNIGISSNVPAGRLSQFTQPIAGINSVTNSAATYDGQNRESDEELRLRAINYQPGAAGTKTSIVNSMLSIEGITGSNIVEYFTQTPVSYTSVDGVTLTSMPGCSFIVFLIGVSPSNAEEVVTTLDEVRSYGILAYAVEAAPTDLNITLEAEYNGTQTAISDLIRTAVTDVLNGSGFGGVVTYSALMRAIASINDILLITGLTFTIPSLGVTLSSLSHSVDMGTVANRDKYLKVQTITINGQQE